MKRRFIDIGANLTDPQFSGIYRGKTKHVNDFEAMLARAKQVGCEKMLVTGSDLPESSAALELAEKHPRFLYSTCGVHPCSAASVPKESDSYWAEVEALAKQGAQRGYIKAYGEFGLDYDRFHYATKEQQHEVFVRQLEIASRVKLPLFLHMRACADDFIALLGPWITANTDSWRGGVVHSFTGTVEELHKLLNLGLYIGINGCSLKTQENLDVVKEVPMDKLMLETDGPWCEIRPSHASSKYTTKLPFDSVSKPDKWQAGALIRGRCEPCQIENVAQVVAGVKNLSVEEVCEYAWNNTVRVFRFDETVDQL